MIFLKWQLGIVPAEEVVEQAIEPEMLRATANVDEEGEARHPGLAI